MSSLFLFAAGEVGSGRIQGGWEFVWASYGLTWGALLLYSVSLFVRSTKEEK